MVTMLIVQEPGLMEDFLLRVKIILLLIIFSNLKSVDLYPSVSAFQTYVTESNESTRKCKDKDGKPLPWRHFNVVTDVGINNYENQSGYLCCQTTDCSDLNNTNNTYGKCTNQEDCTKNTVCFGKPVDNSGEAKSNDEDYPRCSPFESRKSLNDCINNHLGFDFIYLTKMGYCCDLKSGKDGKAGCIPGYLQDQNNNLVTNYHAQCEVEGTSCKCQAKDDNNNGYCYLDRGNSRGIFLWGLPAVSDDLKNFQKVDLSDFESFTKNLNIHAEDKLVDVKNFMTMPSHQIFNFSPNGGGKNLINTVKCGDSSGNGCCEKKDGKYPDELKDDSSSKPVECANGITKTWQKLSTSGVANWFNLAGGSSPIFAADKFCKPTRVLGSSPLTQQQFMKQFKRLFSEIPAKGFKMIFQELRPYQIGTMLQLSNQKQPIKSICDKSDDKSQAPQENTNKSNTPSGNNLDSSDCSFLIGSFFKNYCSSVNGNLITFCSDSAGKDCSLKLSENIPGDDDNSYASAFFALVNDGLIPFAYGADTVYGFYSYLIYYLLEKLKNSPEVESEYKKLVTAFQDKYQKYFEIKSLSDGTTDLARDFHVDQVKYSSLSNEEKSLFALEALQLIKASLNFKPDALTAILWENSKDYSRVAAAAPRRGGIPDAYLDIKNHTMDVAYLVKSLIFFFNHVTIFAGSAQIGLLPTTNWGQYLGGKK